MTKGALYNMPPTEEDEEGRQLWCMGEDQLDILVAMADIQQVMGSHQDEGRVEQGLHLLAELGKQLKGR